MPPVRLPSRETLTAAPRGAPLLRAAQDLAAWAGKDRPVTADGDLTTGDAADAVTALDLSLDEVHAAWAIATGTGMVAVDGDQARPGDRFGVLGDGTPDEALNLWCSALTTVLGLENLDGLTTALYTAARPVRLDALFEAYAAAGGALGHAPPGADEAAETVLTVTLSPSGLWAIRARRAERGWRVPVLGGSADGGAAAVLAVLADYDAEDGEAEIAAWPFPRDPEQAGEELNEAAS